MLKKTIPILSVIAAVVLLLITAKAITNLQEPQNTEHRTQNTGYSRYNTRAKAVSHRLYRMCKFCICTGGF